jgi:hypothetical protein
MGSDPGEGPGPARTTHYVKSSSTQGGVWDGARSARRDLRSPRSARRIAARLREVLRIRRGATRPVRDVRPADRSGRRGWQAHPGRVVQPRLVHGLHRVHGPGRPPRRGHRRSRPAVAQLLRDRHGSGRQAGRGERGQDDRGRRLHPHRRGHRHERAGRQHPAHRGQDRQRAPREAGRQGRRDHRGGLLRGRRRLGRRGPEPRRGRGCASRHR